MSKGEEPETAALEDAQALDEVDTSTDADDSGDDWDEDDGGFEADSDESDEIEETESEEESSDEVEEESTEDSDTEEQSEEADEEQQTEGEAEPKEEDTASHEQDKPEDEKSQQELAHEAFKRREAERKLREEQEARENDQLQRYLDDARDDEVELLRRQQEVNNHLLGREKLAVLQERSSVLQDKLDVSMQRAVSELGLKNMDDKTKQFLARQLDKYEQTNVARDRYGNILQVEGDVYQYIKEEMDSIGHFKGIGAREQTKSKAAEKTRTVTKPTRTPKESKSDPELDAFDEEANRW